MKKYLKAKRELREKHEKTGNKQYKELIAQEQKNFKELKSELNVEYQCKLVMSATSRNPQNCKKYNQTVKITAIKEIINELKSLYNEDSVSDEHKEKITKKIKVYRKGNYTDLLSGSYNTDVLCTSAGATSSDNLCKTE